MLEEGADDTTDEEEEQVASKQRKRNGKGKTRKQGSNAQGVGSIFGSYHAAFFCAQSNHLHKHATGASMPLDHAVSCTYRALFHAQAM
jgi:hypothetical protein